MHVSALLPHACLLGGDLAPLVRPSSKLDVDVTHNFKYIRELASLKFVGILRLSTDTIACRSARRTVGHYGLQSRHDRRLWARRTRGGGSRAAALRYGSLRTASVRGTRCRRRASRRECSYFANSLYEKTNEAATGIRAEVDESRIRTTATAWQRASLFTRSSQPSTVDTGSPFTLMYAYVKMLPGCNLYDVPTSSSEEADMPEGGPPSFITRIGLSGAEAWAADAHDASRCDYWLATDIYTGGGSSFGHVFQWLRYYAYGRDALSYTAWPDGTDLQDVFHPLYLGKLL
ncbi:hypothetical protein C8Q74DRAFT_1442159 [Fomes fomentarius]|nr:hypothetical protein C8Q74DRAFT_1442159 [Fomes fomentarius]